MPIDPSSGLPTVDTTALRHQVLELVARNSWSREEVLDFQQAGLRQALARAVALSEYYREVIGDLVGRGAALRDMPMLTKRMLMDNFDRIVTDRRLSRALIERHLDGARPGDLLFGEHRVAATGGTTGERGIFVYDEPAWLSVIASIGRFQHMLGVLPTTRSVGIAASSPIHLSMRFHAELRAVRPSSPRLDLSMPMSEIVAALNTYRPEAMVAYPSFLRALAEEQLAGHLRISPRVVRSGAEALTESVRQSARAAWGVSVVDSYACTEVGAMGQECGHVCGIHLAEDLCVFENVDEAGRPVLDDRMGARLLVTTLTNRALPLVRYELTDIVAVTAEPCACGLPFARIRTIEGRKEEILHLLGRDGGRLEVHAGRLRSPLLHTRGVRGFQFLPRPDGLDVLVVVEPGHDPDATCRTVEGTLQAALASLGAAPTGVAARLVTSIPRAGSGAKERLVGGRSRP